MRVDINNRLSWKLCQRLAPVCGGRAKDRNRVAWPFARLLLCAWCTWRWLHPSGCTAGAYSLAVCRSGRAGWARANRRIAPL